MTPWPLSRDPRQRDAGTDLRAVLKTRRNGPFPRPHLPPVSSRLQPAPRKPTGSGAVAPEPRHPHAIGELGRLSAGSRSPGGPGSSTTWPAFLHRSSPGSGVWLCWCPVDEPPPRPRQFSQYFVDDTRRFAGRSVPQSARGRRVPCVSDMLLSSLRTSYAGVVGRRFLNDVHKMAFWEIPETRKMCVDQEGEGTVRAGCPAMTG